VQMLPGGISDNFSDAFRVGVNGRKLGKMKVSRLPTAKRV
jgi:hypothetical protein